MTFKNLILIGYRGTGKTTVAPLLADRLGWTWVDADPLLEARTGLSIRQIFEREGEAGFRERESALLAELCAKEHQVIATGGGIVLSELNCARLRGSGKVVWLTADAETIWQRLQSDATTAGRRPNLTAQGGLEEIQELLAVREPLYRACADLIVDTTDRSPEDLAAIICRLLA